MMDDDMDIDDLFGDGAGLSMPARPPSKELIQKVDEMRKSACNQLCNPMTRLQKEMLTLDYRTVAWSRMGLVVAVNSSGFGLELHNIRCHPDDGSWDLSESSPIQQLNTNIEGGPFQHLSFSPTGNELAIIDAVGRISMVLIASAINKPHMIRPAGKDQVDHLHALAGCHWLNTTTHRVSKFLERGHWTVTLIEGRQCYLMDLLFWTEISTDMNTRSFQLPLTGPLY